MTKPTRTAQSLGHRSGLEDREAARMERLGVTHTYEQVVIPYVKRPATYRPDFCLTDNGILIETKGYFLAEDRTKHLLIQEQHPDLDIRFVFARALNPITKGSRTTYASWATKHGFKWADKTIPVEWFVEPPEPRRMAALLALTRQSKPPRR